MKENTIYFLLVLCVISSGLMSQEPVAIVETSFEFIEKNADYSFAINGIDVSESDQNYPIPINKVGFDTIEFSFKTNPKRIAIMKLQQNRIYQLNSNVCSMYLIKPKEEPKQGMVQFRIESIDSAKYEVSVDGLSQRIISRETIDEFYYAPPSVMCPFGVRIIEIDSVEGESLQRIPFHFLHGELVGVVYNAKTDTAELHLYGHVRTEEDYRLIGCGE